MIGDLAIILAGGAVGLAVSQAVLKYEKRQLAQCMGKEWPAWFARFNPDADVGHAALVVFRVHSIVLPVLFGILGAFVPLALFGNGQLQHFITNSVRLH